MENSNAKYTPGPWEAIKTYPYEKSSITICAGSTPKRHIARVLFHDAQTIEDARLIHAAPDLLAVVEVLLETPEMGGRGGVDYLRLEKAARAAVKKAKGE